MTSSSATTSNTGWSTTAKTGAADSGAKPPRRRGRLLRLSGDGVGLFEREEAPLGEALV